MPRARTTTFRPASRTSTEPGGTSSGRRTRRRTIPGVSVTRTGNSDPLIDSGSAARLSTPYVRRTSLATNAETISRVRVMDRHHPSVHGSGRAHIPARAGVTKGAFYHHFPDKKAIFLAVFHETEQALMEASAAGARGPDAWSQFRAGCRAFLEASMDAGVQRIILRDGPVVLGW